MSSGGEAAAPAAKKMRLSAPPEGWLPRRKVNVLGEWADGPAAPLRPAWLVKTALALPAGHPSPAALQGCRVALQDVEGDTLRAFVASGARVYVHELPLPSASAPQRGKGGVLVPGAAAGGATRPLHALPARAELQGLDSAPLGGGGEALLAAVDAYGHVTLSRLRARAPAGASAASDEAYLAAATALAPRVDAVEPSWAGVAFAPGAPTTLATARHLAKTVDVYDGDLHVRCIHTPAHPSAICFLPASEGAHGAGTLVATAEACHVSVWDLRTAGAAALRLPAPSSALLHCLAAAASPAAGACMLAAAGVDRALLVFDVRKARPLRVLPSLMRRDVTSLRFCPLDARCVYAAGADCEVQCRRWDAGAGDGARGAGGGFAKHAAAAAGFAFRGEARWAGLAASGDILAAYCASGALYAARVAPASEADAAADAAAFAEAAGGDDEA